MYDMIYDMHMYIYIYKRIYIYISNTLYYMYIAVYGGRRRSIDMAVCISFLEDEEEGENDCVDNA